MAVVDIVPVPGESFEQTMLSASPDVLREMVRAFAQKMMDAEVEVACGAGYGEVSPNRVNSRNGYRHRKWDTRAATQKDYGRPLFHSLKAAGTMSIASARRNMRAVHRRVTGWTRDVHSPPALTHVAIHRAVPVGSAESCPGQESGADCPAVCGAGNRPPLPPSECNGRGKVGHQGRSEACLGEQSR